MLSDLEARLEDLLRDISRMPEEYVAKAEKASRAHHDVAQALFSVCVARTPVVPSPGGLYSRAACKQRSPNMAF